jgi:hypothetical protein
MRVPPELKRLHKQVRREWDAFERAVTAVDKAIVAARRAKAKADRRATLLYWKYDRTADRLNAMRKDAGLKPLMRVC